MPATIRDVAKAAGVSVATVSRALNGAANVLPDTRARILAAATGLRFTPSGAARSLIMRRTDTIGALLPDLFGEYFSELIRGIDQAARARGLHLLVSSSHGHAGEAAAALRAMSGRVDGLIVLSPHADAGFLSHNLPLGLPAVLLNSGVADGAHATFSVDNFGGARSMAQHLLARGCARIAFIGGPADNHEARERLRGWQAGLGGPAGPGAGRAAIAFDGDFTEEAGAAAGRSIAAAPAGSRPDAVFAANDMMAIGCMAALADAGIGIGTPGGVAVAGFDDIPIARFVSPPLTTVQVGIAELGRRALDGLVAALDAAHAAPDSSSTSGTPDAGSARRHQTIATELVVRKSCGSA